jgi:hypothetical protein
MNVTQFVHFCEKQSNDVTTLRNEEGKMWHSKFCRGNVQNTILQNYWQPNPSSVSKFFSHWKNVIVRNLVHTSLKLPFLNNIYIYKKWSKFMMDLRLCITEKWTVLCGSEDFKGKSAYKILQWFHSNSMATTFEQTYKLSNLVSTILATTALVKWSFLALKRIKVRKDWVISLFYQQIKP